MRRSSSRGRRTGRRGCTPSSKLDGVRVGKKRVARLMREIGLQGISRRGRRRKAPVGAAASPPATPDLVKRKLAAHSIRDYLRQLGEDERDRRGDQHKGCLRHHSRNEEDRLEEATAGRLTPFPNSPSQHASQEEISGKRPPRGYGSGWHTP